MHKNQQNIHVLVRGNETGGITKADIERRASELAMIRTGSADYAESDLEAAARELFGERSPASTTEDAEADTAISRDPSEPPAMSGRSVEHDSSELEENVEPERLTIQGVEEAQHDQMVQAERRARHEERKQ